jgi:hypothetical protein
MSERRVRVLVGEGRSAKKGLLRFVLENEGYDVVAEAASTLELAQQVAVHRPDVVVLDDGIDASAVGMMREVLPSAKVVLVWPRGVTAVGADARIEPSEVMASLGSTMARVSRGGTSIPPAKPRLPVPDVIVVPDLEPPAVGDTTMDGTATPVGATTSEAPVEEPATTAVAVEAPGEEDTSIIVVPETLSGVMMEPSPLGAPSWTYTAPGLAPGATRSRRRGVLAVLAAFVAVLAIVLGAIALDDRVVVRSISGTVGDFQLPDADGDGATSGVTDQPGTYEGLFRIQADGTLALSVTGDARLRLDGLVHLTAQGTTKVRGDGVVKNISSRVVRVSGNGTIRITVQDGRVQLRLQGSLVGQGEGVVKISGSGRFLIDHSSNDDAAGLTAPPIASAPGDLYPGDMF